MMTSIKSRISDLEKQQTDPEGFIALLQSWDDPGLCHPGDRKAPPIPWDQAKAIYKDYTIFECVFEDNWRQNNEQ